MRNLFPIFGFALVGLVVVFGVLAAIFGQDVRHVSWARPQWFLLAVVPIAAVAIRQWLSPRPATMRFSRVSSLRRLRSSFFARLIHLPDGLRLCAALLVVVAIGRPQSTRGSDRIRHQGIDIVLALDLSESMDTPDMPPAANRLGAAQLVIDDFIRRRPRDRIGLVAFGSTASTVSPLTMDHGVLRKLVNRLRLGILEGKQTAIGAGLGVALNRLDESQADSQVIVLLTDGVHNADGLDPDSAASEAAQRGIRVYTILMGRHQRGVAGSIDPGRLERIASVTGGYAYTAADADALQGSFQDLLDKLERSAIEGQQVRPELFAWFLWAAFGLVLLDVGLRSTRLRRFP